MTLSLSYVSYALVSDLCPIDACDCRKISRLVTFEPAAALMVQLLPLADLATSDTFSTNVKY